MLSTTENKTLMAEARESLRGKWGLAVGAMLLYFVIIAVAQSIPRIGGLIGLLITGPFTLGFTSLCPFPVPAGLSRNRKAL